MEFGRAFTYPFEDQDWLKKIALAALVSLIPIVGQLFLLGWGLEIARRVIQHDPVVLPDLDFGANLGKGFQAFLVSLVYSIPIFILSLPMNLIGPIGSALEFDADSINVMMIAVSICCGGLTLIYSIALAFALPAAFGNLAAKGQLSAGFKFSEIFALIKAAPVAYLLVVLGSLVAGIIGSLGVIACAIGVIFTYAYAMAIMGHLYGQAYNQATAAGAAV